MKTQQASFVGVDVSKGKVDIAIRPSGEHWQLSNEEIDLAVTRLCALQPSWIVLEATGGYELPWVEAFSQAGLKVSRPHVTRISHHARGKGMAKTDKLDAQVLAHYAECYSEHLRVYQPDEMQMLLKTLCQRRLQLIGMRTEEKNRIQHTELPTSVLDGMKCVIGFLDEQIKAVEQELAQIIKSHEALHSKYLLLQSLPGIGETVATGLVCLLPELGKGNRKEIAALVGVVPIERSSGKMRGKSTIRGGRFEVRQLLYMSALSAIRYNPRMKSFYQRLRDNGKSGKQAVVACMHKMLRILNAMLKSQQPYQLT